MGKKRKQAEAQIVAPEKPRDAPERPQRTLLGWKDSAKAEESKDSESTVFFRNKEKVLVTCSRRINVRFAKQEVPVFCGFGRKYD